MPIDVKKSYHSIDSRGHLVEGGPLDERLRNIEARMEGGGISNRSSLPAIIAADIDALRAELRTIRTDRCGAHLSAHARNLDEAVARIAKIEESMRLMCMVLHGTVPMRGGTITLSYAPPVPTRIAHVRLTDDADAALRIASMEWGAARINSDGKVDATLLPGVTLRVTVSNVGEAFLDASVLVFYEEMCECPLPPGLAAYASGYAQGAKMLGK